MRSPSARGVVRADGNCDSRRSSECGRALRLAGRFAVALSGGGGIRTLGAGVTGSLVFKTSAFNRSATPPGRPSPPVASRVSPSGYAGSHGGTEVPGLAQLVSRAALQAGRDPPSPHPGGTARRGDRGAGGRPSHPRRRLGPLLHRRRPDRGDDAAARAPRPDPRGRPQQRARQGRGGHRPARSRPPARRPRARPGEPRRHRPSDAGGLDLHRDARDRRPLRQPLFPGGGDRAGQPRRPPGRADPLLGPRTGCSRRGSGWGRSASSTR